MSSLPLQATWDLGQMNSEVDFPFHDFPDTGAGGSQSTLLGSWGGHFTRATQGRSLAVEGQADSQPMAAFSASHFRKE